MSAERGLFHRCTNGPNFSSLSLWQEALTLAMTPFHEASKRLDERLPRENGTKGASENLFRKASSCNREGSFREAVVQGKVLSSRSA